ncbi:MAG: DUF4476 domain-containing protein [Bacteroidota bacterium]
MKKLIAICAVILVFATQNVKANYALSELNLKMHDNLPFYAVLDNITFPASGSSLLIDNVRPGQHKLKVFKIVQNPYNPWLTTKVMAYNGFIMVPAGAKVFSLIDAYRTFTIVNQVPLFANNGCNNNNWNNEYSDCVNDENEYTNNYTDYGYSSNNNYYAPSVMSNNAFISLKTMLANTSFDSSKLSIAQQALMSNTITSNQVAQLMEMFDFESSRLKFSKMAYTKTIDKQNFYIVNGAFDFNSSITELANYIGGV